MAPRPALSPGRARLTPRARLLALAVAVAAMVVAAAVAEPTREVDAQDPFVPAELASFEPSGVPLPDPAENLAMSALGHVVSYEYRPDDSAVLMRVRTDPSIAVPNPAIGESHGLSDDGCVIAYTGPFAMIGEFPARTMYRFNRCSGGASTYLGFYFSRLHGRPAVDADGSVVAFPGFNGIDVHTMSGNAVAQRVLIPAPSQGWTVAEAAISDNGATMAVIAGPDADNNGFLESSSLYILDVASQTYQGIATTSHRVSMSGDGSLVAYRNYGNGQITVLDRNAGQNRPVIPANDAFISRDGRHLGLQLFAGDNSFVYVASSNDRWVSASSADLLSYTLPGVNSFVSASDPVLSEHGRWVGWISPNAYLYVEQPPGITRFNQRQALVRERRPVLTVQSLEYGTVSGPSTRSSTVTNVGPSGWRVTSIETTGEYQVVAENCPDVLHPGVSCNVEVRYLAQTPGQAVGELRVRDNSYPGVPLAASGRLTGIFEPDIPPPPPPGGTTTTTTTTQPDTPPSSGLSIAPNPVVFADAVVGQSSATQEATVTNVGEIAVTVQSVSVTGSDAADFVVIDDGCTDEVLAPGGTCELTVRFTPSDAGGRSGTLTVAGTSTTSASAAMRGGGRFDVRLEVLPVVAAGGQVVTVTGTGYPSSASVGVTLAGSPPQQATTDGSGRFALQWLVLEGTPQGTVEADDVATERYDAEPVELQIVPSPMRPQANVALDRSVRSHVSR